jgi:hypothetical protein
MIGERVVFIGPESDGLPPFIGRKGSYVGLGKLHIRRIADTKEEHAEKCDAYSVTHSMIHWDGCTYAWNCPNDSFKFLKEDKKAK